MVFCYVTKVAGLGQATLAVPSTNAVNGALVLVSVKFYL